MERFKEDFDRENIIFDNSLKNLERLQKDIINIKNKDVIIKNNILQKKEDIKTVNIIFLIMILMVILITFFKAEQKSIYLFMQSALIGISLYLIVFLPIVFISYFKVEFYEIEYLHNIGVNIKKKRKNILINKEKIKRVYLMADVQAKLIKNELYKKLEARKDVKIIGCDQDSAELYGKPRIFVYMYIEYYENAKIKTLRLDANNIVMSELKEFISIFEI